MPHRVLLLLLSLVAAMSPALAQVIRGEVLDMNTRRPIESVNIEDIYSILDATTDSTGAFFIAAKGGELLEFRKPGYKLTRVRVPRGYIPPFFRIIMQQGPSEINDKVAEHNNRYDYRDDSLRFHELYAHELDFPRMSAIDMISHPFSAMSGKNREIWRFQDEYDEFEKEKYVDKTFNEELVSGITGLKGDSLHYFMRRYRPTYEQLRNMNDYSFYSLIKFDAYSYRNQYTPRNAQ